MIHGPMLWPNQLLHLMGRFLVLSCNSWNRKLKRTSCRVWHQMVMLTCHQFASAVDARVSALEDAGTLFGFQAKPSLKVRLMKACNGLMLRSTNFSCRFAAQFEAQRSDTQGLFTAQMGQIEALLSKKARMNEPGVKPSRPGMVETFCLHWVGFTCLVCYQLLGLANSLSWGCNRSFWVCMFVLHLFRLRVQIGLRWTSVFRRFVCFCP